MPINVNVLNGRRIAGRELEILDWRYTGMKDVPQKIGIAIYENSNRQVALAAQVKLALDTNDLTRAEELRSEIEQCAEESGTLQRELVDHCYGAGAYDQWLSHPDYHPFMLAVAIRYALSGYSDAAADKVGEDWEKNEQALAEMGQQWISASITDLLSATFGGSTESTSSATTTAPG